ncbi:MAG TPA: lactonase family protein [Planctomycetota bacterium]|nr:lactonase family protein [Planctomycetota bacterium]
MTRLGRWTTVLACALAVPAGWAGEERVKKAESCLVYTGSYSDAKDEGIQVFSLDLSSGALTKVGGASGASNPSFLAIHPGKKFIYAACEAGRTGSVAAFGLDEKGIPTLLNMQPSEGSGPCFVTVDKAGKNVLAANYGSGSVACVPIGDDGKLLPPSSSVQHKGSSVNKSRQEGPHAHSINLDAANHFAFAADLGLDKILVYKFDSAKGTLVPNDPPAAEVPPGSGPRHFAFHPSGKYAYACGEMAMTVIAFTYDAEHGVLKEQQVLSTLPEGAERKGASTAETQVSPDGKHVYVSNRGHNTVAVFEVDPATGKLKAAGHCPTGGKTPRNFGIDPSGKFLIAANQDSNNVVVFKIDPATGMPSPCGHEVQVPKPVCVKFLAK